MIALSANGGVRAEVAAGEEVQFAAEIEMPPGAGMVVGAEWDFTGEGLFTEAAGIAAAAGRVTVPPRTPGTSPAPISPCSRRRPARGRCRDALWPGAQHRAGAGGGYLIPAPSADSLAASSSSSSRAARSSAATFAFRACCSPG